MATLGAKNKEYRNNSSGTLILQQLRVLLVKKIQNTKRNLLLTLAQVMQNTKRNILTFAQVKYKIYII